MSTLSAQQRRYITPVTSVQTEPQNSDPTRIAAVRAKEIAKEVQELEFEEDRGFTKIGNWTVKKYPSAKERKIQERQELENYKKSKYPKETWNAIDRARQLAIEAHQSDLEIAAKKRWTKISPSAEYFIPGY
ncbi:hypothetical protein HK098_008060 [Nowakowskiella sp. JEL0407]|nr:hypothetical protein HK098_008060 [Nowakowskiella sp. JEL0407]